MKKTTAKRVAVSAAKGTILVPQAAFEREVQLLIPAEPAIGLMIDERPESEGDFAYKTCPAYVGPVSLTLGPGQFVFAVAAEEHAIVTVLTTFESDEA